MIQKINSLILSRWNNEIIEDSILGSVDFVIDVVDYGTQKFLCDVGSGAYKLNGFKPCIMREAEIATEII